MKKAVSEHWDKKVKANLPIIIAAVLYFGLLAITLYQKIKDKATEGLLQLAFVVTACAVGSYIMFFYTKNRMKKRHVTQNTEMEFEITKKRILLDRLTAVLFLLVGVILMVLTLL